MDTASPQQRLLALSQAQGVSLSELSRLLDRNSSYLQQFVRKGSPRKLEETDRRTLARFFGVSESELGAPEENSFASAAGMGNSEDWANVPRLQLGVSAGPGATDPAEQAIGTLRFSRRWLRGQGLDPAMLSIVVVMGDSMEPTLRDGDEILVDRRHGPLRDGIHVVRLDSALLVKRLDTGKPGRIALISDNHSYPALDATLRDVQVVGRVVWKGGRL